MHAVYARRTGTPCPEPLPYARPMRRLLLLALILGLVLRKRKLDAYDREHGLGAYAPVKPVVKESAGG